MLKKITPAIAALAAVHALAQTWNETFETGSKGTYAAGDVTCVMGSWHMDQCLIGSSSGDRCFGEQSVRLKTGRLEMNFDKTNGVGVLSAYFAKYGADGDSTLTVECSTDGSNTWFQVGSAVAVTSATLTLVTVPVNTNGAVRFRLSKEGDARVNIDNISITDYGCVTVPPIVDPITAKRVRIGQTLSFTMTIFPTDGDPVTYTNATASSGVTGTWSLQNGLFSYTPAEADLGERSFDFAVADKDGTNTVTAAVTVARQQADAIRLITATGSYTQNFDTLATAGTANEWDNAALPFAAWYAYAGMNAVATYQAGTGSGSSGGLYSWGTSSASTDRSLGSLASGTTGDLRYGLALTNETDKTITNLTVSFTAEQWRVGASALTNALVFDVCVTNHVIPLTQGVWCRVNALCFDSPTVTNASEAPGAVCRWAVKTGNICEQFKSKDVLIMRWTDLDDTGNDHGFGIDDLAVTWVAGVPSDYPRGSVVLLR